MSGSPIRGAVALAALSLVLGFVGRQPGQERTLAGTKTAEAASTQEALPTMGTRAAPGQVREPTRGRPARGAGLACAPGRNGGSTDRGVSATEIRLASTIVLDGTAASLLSPAVAGMKAVIVGVNGRGGICGRRLTLVARNDSFEARRGHDFIRTWATDPRENIFALSVVPSAEGLSAAISAGVIREAGIPVVGTDGMRREQYEDPWVWPVGTATVSTMRVMAKYGYERRDARTFAVVYDSKYKFGLEGAEAFKDQVKRLGGTLVEFRPIDSDQSSFGNEVAAFNAKCGGGRCDMVALLLLPDTAKAWLLGEPVKGKLYTAGAQTLFSNGFAQGCVQAIKDACHAIAVWTGYNPPLGRFAGLPGVSRYVSDVTTVRPGIDTQNQFLEGAYLGMSLLVEALERVGPNLTRLALKRELDAMTFRTDLASALTWRPGRHSANANARAFSMIVSQGDFRGWADENTGWIADPSGGVRA